MSFLVFAIGFFIGALVACIAVLWALFRWRPTPSPRMQRLMAMGGYENREVFIADALTFWEAMAEQVMAGDLVGVKRANGEFVQLLTPGLKWAKDTGAVTRGE